MENCKQFVIDVLKRKGALDVDALLEACRNDPAVPNCPKALKSADISDFESYLRNQSATFSLKGNQVCLSEQEAKFKNELISTVLKNGCLPFADSKGVLNSCDKVTAAYIQARGWQQGILDFLKRNDDAFLVKSEKIYCQKPVVVTEDDEPAVTYFLKFLTEKGPLTFAKLVGHLNQAPPEVKKIVKSTNREIFELFLTRNSLYFEINGDVISKREVQSLGAPLFDESDVLEEKTINYFSDKIKQKGTRTIHQLVSLLSHDGPAEVIGTVGSRKLEDVQSFIQNHPTVFCIDNGTVSLLNKILHQPKIALPVQETSVQPDTHQHNQQTQIMSSSIAADNTFLDENNRKSKETFSHLFGDSFCNSLCNLLATIKIKDFSRIETMWFDFGKRPLVKVLTDNSSIKYVIHELKDEQFVGSTLFYQVQLKVNQHSLRECGVPKTLHTIRLNVQGKHEAVLGITFFHQTHLNVTHNQLKENEQNNLLAILYDRAKTTFNILYSYMRSICHNLAEHHHVIIVDYNGKITGYDETVPESVGRSRRLHCSDFASRSEALLEAFAHGPDYIVTNCLDTVDTTALQTIKMICEQGVQIVVALNSTCIDILNG